MSTNKIALRVVPALLRSNQIMLSSIYLFRPPLPRMSVMLDANTGGRKRDRGSPNVGLNSGGPAVMGHDAL